MSLPLVAAALIVVLGAVLIRVVNWVWITPKELERYLRRQGLPGTPYTPLVGDIKKNIKMLMEARSKPISLTDDVIPYLLPLALKMFNSHGTALSLSLSLSLSHCLFHVMTQTKP